MGEGAKRVRIMMGKILWKQLGLERAERAADERLGGGGRIGIENAADSFARVDLFVTQGDQREFRIGGGRGDLAGGGVLPGIGDADLVFKLKNNALGGLFSNPLGLGKQYRITGDDGRLELPDRHPAEDGEGDGGADPGDAVDQQEKHVALLLGGEAVEGVGVLADVKVGAEIDRRALGGVEEIVGGNGDHCLVANAVAIHDQAVGEGFDDFSTESCDHGQRFREKRPRMQVVRLKVGRARFEGYIWSWQKPCATGRNAKSWRGGRSC